MLVVLWSGLAVGAIYALVAAGYNVFFIASGGFNFAHAYLLMLGVFVAEWGLVDAHLPVVVVFLMTTVAIAACAMVEEVTAIRPVHSTHALLVTTLGVATFITGACQLIWGGGSLVVPTFSQTTSFLGGTLTLVDLVLIVMAILIVALIILASRKTMIGLALLAIAEDREAAVLRGVNARALGFAAFAFSGALAGFVAPAVGVETMATVTLGTSLALKGFVALAIGGFGSFSGSLIGGFVVGVVEAFAEYQFGAQYSDLFIFAILIGVLFFRPQGLFFTMQERRV